MRRNRRIKADIIGPNAQSGRFPAMSAMAHAPSPVEGGRSPGGGYRNRILYLLDFGNPNDIANACIYLLRDASRWVTGGNLVVDGGYTTR